MKTILFSLLFLNLPVSAATIFCREDYICQNLPQDISRVYSGETREKVRKRSLKLGAMGVGFCVPNYFVFNMRTDGHIIPDSRK